MGLLKVTLSIGFSCPWMAHLARRYEGEATLLQCIPQSTKRGVSSLAKIRAPAGKAEALARAIRELKGIEEVTLTEIGKGIFLGMVKTSSCPCAFTLLPYHHVVKVEQKDERRLRWVILVKDGKELKRLIAQLEDKRIEYEIEEICGIKERWYLTPRQEQILQVALELGYYDVPKRIGLKELAQVLGTSPRAVSEVLRRAHRNLVKRLAIGGLEQS